MSLNVGAQSIEARAVNGMIGVKHDVWQRTHLVLSADELDVVRQFLTTNPSGFLRDCSNMLQGIMLCIERLEKWFKNVDAGTKELSEVIQQFTDKIQNLKPFEAYDVLLDKKIGDALTQRAKITDDVENKKSILVTEFRGKCKEWDMWSFDSFVGHFNQEVSQIRTYLWSGISATEARTYMIWKITYVKDIITALDDIISGKKTSVN